MDDKMVIDMEINIRQASKKDVDEIRFLFRDTVTFINSADYKQDEISVWADSYKNVESLTKKILNQYFLVATMSDKIVGFSSLTDNGYLDFMYVHKDFQRQGIAKRLLVEIEMQAEKLLLKKIFSHVSKTARPFFEKNGYIKTGDQINKVQNIEFVNSVMIKTI